MRKINSLCILAVGSLALLAGCSGEDVFNAVPTPAPGGADNAGDVTAVTSLRVFADSASLNTGTNTVDSGITVFAVAQDSGGVLLPQIPIKFSTTEISSDGTNGVCKFDANPQSSGGALQVATDNPAQPDIGVTDETGTARAILTAGGDNRNRCVEVNAQIPEGVSGRLVVPVSGTAFSVTGPSTIATGAEATFSLVLTDGTGGGIANQAVEVSTADGNGNLLSNPRNPNAAASSTITVITNSSGGADFVMSGGVGDASSDPDARENISVTAFNLQQNKRVSVSSLSLQVSGLTVQAPGKSCDTDPNSSLLEIALGISCQIQVELSDANSDASGRQVSLRSTRGVVTPDTALTDANGRAVFDVTANQSDGAGPAILQATATVSDGQTADSKLDVEFVATLAETITLQAEPATAVVNGDAIIKAVVRDLAGNLVKNQIVDFSIQDSSAGSLSSASQVTNSQGLAQVTFTASSTSSAADGVIVTGRVRATNPVVENNVEFTVGGTALRITLGTGNELVDDVTVYRVPYAVVVTDVEGNPPPSNTVFRLAVRSIGYQKGVYVRGAETWQSDYFIEGAEVQPFPLSNGVFDVFGCAQEDLNLNGILDPGEDDPEQDIDNVRSGNGNGILDPGNVATVPANIELVNGFAQFDLVYPQQFATWTKVQLRAVASVAGTETTEAQEFVLPVNADDLDLDGTPPGQPSPFGTATTCIIPN